MKPINLKILAGTAALAIIGTASRLQAQPYDSPYAGPASSRYYAAPLFNQFYLSLDAGAAWQEDITIRDSIGDSENVTFDTGARLDLDLGYSFTRNLSAELEVGLIIIPVKQSFVLGTDFMNVDFAEFPVMVNVIYTQPLGHHFSAYIGGGIGGAFSDYSNDFGDSTPTDSAFAFQGMAGIKYTFDEWWSLSIGYKFLGTTDHDLGPGIDSNGSLTEIKSDGTFTHSILVAITCRF